MTCNGDLHRVLLTSPGPSKCKCQLGWFEETIGVEECKKCYYTWQFFNNNFLNEIKVQQQNIQVAIKKMQLQIVQNAIQISIEFYNL